MSVGGGGHLYWGWACTVAGWDWGWNVALALIYVCASKSNKMRNELISQQRCRLETKDILAWPVLSYLSLAWPSHRLSQMALYGHCCAMLSMRNRYHYGPTVAGSASRLLLPLFRSRFAHLRVTLPVCSLEEGRVICAGRTRRMRNAAPSSLPFPSR